MAMANLGEFRMLFNTILNYKDLEGIEVSSAQKD
jgi:hypothetical protein